MMLQNNDKGLIGSFSDFAVATLFKPEELYAPKNAAKAAIE